jgi:hypothetical protein
MPTDPPDTAREPSPPDAHADAGPPLKLSPTFVRWHVALSLAITAVALGVVLWPQGWPLEGRGRVHSALLLLMSAQKVQVGGQFKKTKFTCHHAPLRQHVQEASCGGVQDMRRRGPYGQDVWSP